MTLNDLIMGNDFSAADPGSTDLNLSAAGIKGTNILTNLQLYIFGAVLLICFIAALAALTFLLRNIEWAKEFAQKTLVSTIESTFFNGIIDSMQFGFINYCLLAYGSVKLGFAAGDLSVIAQGALIYTFLLAYTLWLVYTIRRDSQILRTTDWIKTYGSLIS